MHKRIKVVWICEFSNPKVRSSLSFKKDYIVLFVRKLMQRQSMVDTDYGIWITNGIEEIKQYSDIDLYVISPHYHIRGKEQRFVIDGVHFYFFNDEKNSLFFHIKKKISNNNHPLYLNNRRIIKNIIDKINPDIIHLIGAENPHYSLSALDVSKQIPLIVQLQTLVSDPEFIKKYPNYNRYNVECEKQILRRADYIGTTIIEYQDIIKNNIAANAHFLNLKLAVGFNLKPMKVPKEFDFIYFSVNINKAFDLALEAFALAYQKNPEITMCVVGYYSSDYKNMIDKRISELKLEKVIHFQGHQPTHDDVLKWVAKSRFALLPLKFDIVSTTIREAMSLGVPVITTITSGTPKLNEVRESILLSEISDHAAMADNMIKLLTNINLAKKLTANAFETLKELYDNAILMKEWVKSYRNLVHYESK